MYFPLLLKWQNPILHSTVTCLKRFPLIRKNVSLSTIWKKYQCRAFSWYGRNCFQRQYRRCEKSDWFLISRNQSLFSCTFFCSVFCFVFFFGFYVFRFQTLFVFSFFFFFEPGRNSFVITVMTAPAAIKKSAKLYVIPSKCLSSKRNPT